MLLFYEFEYQMLLKFSCGQILLRMHVTENPFSQSCMSSDCAQINLRTKQKVLTYLYKRSRVSALFEKFGIHAWLSSTPTHAVIQQYPGSIFQDIYELPFRLICSTHYNE